MHAHGCPPNDTECRCATVIPSPRINCGFWLRPLRLTCHAARVRLACAEIVC
ncbi:hypothetical protein PATSB16_00170 [Pandoraea thiooxydans]|nr:hypothetical protein PATSB16_00170 [Pandoraea thiooxydans]